MVLARLLVLALLICVRVVLLKNTQISGVCDFVEHCLYAKLPVFVNANRIMAMDRDLTFPVALHAMEGKRGGSAECLTR